jgi:uncharacterized BrkB/YihY/UPF0761 family membrane protein
MVLPNCRETSIYVVALVTAVLFHIAQQAFVFFGEHMKNLITDAQLTLEG